MIFPQIFQITDQHTLSLKELCHRLEQVAELSVAERTKRAVMLRDPEWSGKALWDMAIMLRKKTSELGLQFWMNDRVDIAALVLADGIHLGRHSLPASVVRAQVGNQVQITVSCHSLEELEDQAAWPVDGMMLSPIFTSPGKAQPLGVDCLFNAKSYLQLAQSSVKLVALGGVSECNAEDCFHAGADSVASIRANLMAVKW